MWPRAIFACVIGASVALSSAQVTSTPSVTSSGHKPGPFTTLIKSMPQEKRKSFQELLKKLRTAKQLSDKDERRKQTVSIDVDIHKLLGDSYKQYRAITAATKEAHLATKAAGGATGASVATASASAPKASSLGSMLPKRGGGGGKKKLAAAATATAAAAPAPAAASVPAPAAAKPASATGHAKRSKKKDVLAGRKLLKAVGGKVAVAGKAKGLGGAKRQFRGISA